MTFQKGHSGNPSGRPRRIRGQSQIGTVKQAWDELNKERPELIKDALERGIEGKRSLGYLELGAKLGGEIGNQGDGRQQIAIIFNSTLDTAKLRPGAQAVHVIEGCVPRIQELAPERIKLETPILEAEVQEVEVLESLDEHKD